MWVAQIPEQSSSARPVSKNFLWTHTSWLNLILQSVGRTTIVIT